MNIYMVKDYDELSRKAANIISAQVTLKPTSVLGLATGSTPIGTYKQLIERYQKGDIDFSNITSVNLDEYKGLSNEHSQSYRYFMNKYLFHHVNIRKEKIFIPNGLEDSEKECARYDLIIETVGGIDMLLLGIGTNGHIGFNEPGDCFEKGTHLVKLTQETRKVNARFFSSIDEVPTHAYTMGVGNIMAAKKILLLASGESKANALYDSFFGTINPTVPASILQLHSDVTIVADEAALSIIHKRGFWKI